jgi:glutathione S-transferase
VKDIIFCADGTWNGQDVDKDDDGVPDATNVLKLFHLLQGETTLESRRLKDESEKVLGDSAQPKLVAKYLHGVGDSDNPIRRVAGGAFGSGLIARIAGATPSSAATTGRATASPSSASAGAPTPRVLWPE